MSGRARLFHPLTDREEHVVELLAQELTTREIADRLGISRRTVEAHLDNAAGKVPGNLPRAMRVVCWWRGATLKVLNQTT